MTVKTIRSSGGDYTSISAWIAGCPADITAGGTDEIWEGVLYKEGGGTNNEWTATSGYSVSGVTGDSTHYLWLHPVSGSSIKDSTSNALRADTSVGVSVVNTGSYAGVGPTFFVSSPMRLTGLIIRKTGTDGGSLLNGGIVQASAYTYIENCILDRATGTGGGPVVRVGAASVTLTIVNSVLISRSSGYGYGSEYASGTTNIRACTIIGNGSNTAFKQTYAGATVNVVDCAVFNFTAIGASNLSGNNNATDLSSMGFGTSNQTSVAYSTSTFVSITGGSEDWKAVSGSGLAANGVRDNTYTSDLDFFGQARSTTAPTIGAFEIVASAPPQLAAPTSDITAGWTPSTGSTIYGVIDESTADDGDYAYTTANATAEVKFEPLDDPAVNTGHIVRYRLSVASGTTCTVSLRQGSTLIDSWVHTGPVSLTTFEQTLGGTEADSITDYTDLRLRAVTS